MRRAASIALVAAVISALSGGLAGGAGVAAADLHSINTWVVVSGTRPAVGCAINVSVEVRASGYPVGQTEVTVALFAGDTFISIDHGVTNSDGIAYLTIDTNGAWPGANGWLDVLIAGAYVTGLSILPTSDGACTDGSRMITASGLVPAVQASSPSSGHRSGLVSFWVPTYVQQRPLSCEYAALYIATAAWGYGISEYAFDEVVGWSPNPHWGYRGNIHGAWGNTTDYGVYAAPLAAALEVFGFRGDAFFAAGDASQLTWRLDAGIPVLVWLGLWGDLSHYEWVDGARFKLVAGMHVVVAYGYDANGVYVSDPARGEYRFFSWGDFMYMWNILDGMGLGVVPY